MFTISSLPRATDGGPALSRPDWVAFDRGALSEEELPAAIASHADVNDLVARFEPLSPVTELLGCSQRDHGHACGEMVDCLGFDQLGFNANLAVRSAVEIGVPRQVASQRIDIAVMIVQNRGQSRDVHLGQRARPLSNQSEKEVRIVGRGHGGRLGSVAAGSDEEHIQSPSATQRRLRKPRRGLLSTGWLTPSAFAAPVATLCRSVGPLRDGSVASGDAEAFKGSRCAAGVDPGRCSSLREFACPGLWLERPVAPQE